ncbi:MAG: hypothetical protein NTV88_06265, partial [Candidatus Micrarchaeota archaeon]|nr:hypothetical protein [Candidatus Micrarchaeota archaeon]
DNPAAKEIFFALKDGLQKMRAKQVEHSPLTLSETEKTQLSKEKTTGWVQANSKEMQNYLSYYSYETLAKEEQQFIISEKSYARQGLVLANGHDLNSGVDGVAQYVRSRLSWLLPKMNVGTTHDYFTEVAISGNDAIFVEYANALAKEGMSANDVQRKIESGISDYQSITRRLMEKEGVFVSLERLEKYPPKTIDGILAEIRAQIEKSN